MNCCKLMDNDEEDEGVQILRELKKWQSCNPPPVTTESDGPKMPISSGILKEVANNQTKNAFIVSINQKLISKMPHLNSKNNIITLAPKLLDSSAEQTSSMDNAKQSPPALIMSRKTSNANPTTLNREPKPSPTNGTDRTISPIRTVVAEPFTRNNAAANSSANCNITRRSLSPLKDEMIIEIKLDPVHEQNPMDSKHEQPNKMLIEKVDQQLTETKKQLIIDFTKDSDFERFIFEQPLAFERIEATLLSELPKSSTLFSNKEDNCDLDNQSEHSVSEYAHNFNDNSLPSPSFDQNDDTDEDHSNLMLPFRSVPPPRTPSPPPPPTPPDSDYDDEEMDWTVSSCPKLSAYHSEVLTNDLNHITPPPPLPLSAMLSVASDFFTYPPPPWMPPMEEWTLIGSVSGTSRAGTTSPPPSFYSSSPSLSNHKPSSHASLAAKQLHKKDYIHGYPTYYERFLATVFSWNPEWAHRDNLSFETKNIHLPSQFSWLKKSLKHISVDSGFNDLRQFKAVYIPHLLLTLFHQIHDTVLDQLDRYEYTLEIRRQQDYFGISDFHEKPFLSLLTLIVKQSDEDEHDPRPPFRKGDLILIRGKKERIFQKIGIVQDLSIAKVRANKQGTKKVHEVTLLVKKTVARLFNRDSTLKALFLLNSKVLSEAKFVYHLTPRSLFVNNVIMDKNQTFAEIVSAIKANCL